MALRPDDADLRMARDAIVELLGIRMRMRLADSAWFELKLLHGEPAQARKLFLVSSEERSTREFDLFKLVGGESVGHVVLPQQIGFSTHCIIYK